MKLRGPAVGAWAIAPSLRSRRVGVAHGPGILNRNFDSPTPRARLSI